MIQSHSIDLGAADLTAGGSGSEKALSGRYVGLHPASHPSAVLEVSFGRQPGRSAHDYVTLTPGVVLPVDPFHALRVRLASGVPATAGRTALLYASEEPLTFPPRTAAVDADGRTEGQAQPTELTCSRVDVDENATQVAAANTARRSLLVRNEADSEAYVFVGGDNTVTDETGFALGPGEALELEVTGTVYAICSAGEDATVHVAEEA